MNLKDIATGIITGAVLALAGTFFVFQERVTKLEAKYDTDKTLVERSSKEYKGDANKKINLYTATGKTTLTSEECSTQAKTALEKNKFLNIDIKASMQNGQEVSSPSTESPRSITAINSQGDSFHIFCKPFNTEIVIFSQASTSTNELKKIWDAFY